MDPVDKDADPATPRMPLVRLPPDRSRPTRRRLCAPPPTRTIHPRLQRASPKPQPSALRFSEKLHAPILFLNGGPGDSGFASAKANFEFISVVPAVLAYQEVGHYPATYRQPNGGAFAKAVGAWLKWQLKGDQTAKKMFVGGSCGLCTDSSWKIDRKKLE